MGCVQSHVEAEDVEEVGAIPYGVSGYGYPTTGYSAYPTTTAYPTATAYPAVVPAPSYIPTTVAAPAAEWPATTVAAPVVPEITTDTSLSDFLKKLKNAQDAATAAQDEEDMLHQLADAMNNSDAIQLYNPSTGTGGPPPPGSPQEALNVLVAQLQNAKVRVTTNDDAKENPNNTSGVDQVKRVSEGELIDADGSPISLATPFDNQSMPRRGNACGQTGQPDCLATAMSGNPMNWGV